MRPHGAIGLLLALASCGRQPLYQQSEAMEGRIWHVADRPVFEVGVTDTVSGYDFFLNIRIGDGYPFANMYLFITTEFPDGSTVRDTVECILADPTGRWLGTGIGDLKDNRILFRPNVRFPSQGTYRFTMEQAMRTEQLPEVADVGLAILPR